MEPATTGGSHHIRCHVGRVEPSDRVSSSYLLTNTRYDEGTAFLPVVSKKRQLPVHEKYGFMALDEDGYDLPPDWYAEPTVEHDSGY